jgi:hypothetical protein
MDFDGAAAEVLSGAYFGHIVNRPSRCEMGGFGLSNGDNLKGKSLDAEAAQERAKFRAVLLQV